MSGLRSVTHQVTRFARGTVVSLVRLQVLKPETDPLPACVLDRTLLDGIPEAGNHHCRDAGCWQEGRPGQLIWPKQFVSKLKTVILSRNAGHGQLTLTATAAPANRLYPVAQAEQVAPISDIFATLFCLQILKVSHELQALA